LRSACCRPPVLLPRSSLTPLLAPAQLAIAGLYPGLTADELLAPQPLPFAEPGLWNYHRLTPDGVPGGFVALPGSELVIARPNTVAVVCSSMALGVEFQDQEDHECLALIDRSDEAVRCSSETRRPRLSYPWPCPRFLRLAHSSSPAHSFPFSYLGPAHSSYPWPTPSS